MSVGRAIAGAPVRFYRRFISPYTSPRCKYAPTCSTYALEAIEVHGPLKGVALATWRLMRCNPWSHGGVDRVPPKGAWRPDPYIPSGDWEPEEDETPIPSALRGILSDGPGLVDHPHPPTAGTTN